MTQKEKLIELLVGAICSIPDGLRYRYADIESIADNLLANGVTVQTELERRHRMTNADYIRSISDEELAKFIYDVLDDEGGWAKIFDGYFLPCYYLDDIVKWLKQPREAQDASD